MLTNIKGNRRRSVLTPNILECGLSQGKSARSSSTGLRNSRNRRDNSHFRTSSKFGSSTNHLIESNENSVEDAEINEKQIQIDGMNLDPDDPEQIAAIVAKIPQMKKKLKFFDKILVLKEQKKHNTFLNLLKKSEPTIRKFINILRAAVMAKKQNALELNKLTEANNYKINAKDEYALQNKSKYTNVVKDNYTAAKEQEKELFEIKSQFQKDLF